jgi:branched-chain amino acid transport system substrate-binding protein
MRSMLVIAAIAAAAPAGAQSTPYTFDVILPMTGQAAFSGLAESQSIAAYEKYLNANGGIRGAQVHFDIHDDQSSPQVALQLANAAMARKVPVIFGSAVVATCSSIGAAVANAGPVMFCFSPGYTPPKDSYAFATGATIFTLTKTILMYAKRRDFKRVAFLGSTDATGIVSATANAESFKSPDLRGVELVADERVSTGDVSANAQLAKIKAARPDVLWTSTSGTVFGTVMHAMADVGLDVPVLTTTANANSTQLKSLAGYLPRELYFNAVPFQLRDLLKDRALARQNAIFADALKANGIEPTPLHTFPWDPIMITVAAYRQFGPAMTAEQLRTFTLGLRHFPGLNGNYDFSKGDQHGLDSSSIVIVGWDRDKQEFYPASQLGGVPIKR